MYAHRTKVPVNNTRSEIEKLLERKGATGFVFGANAGQAMLVFEMHDWRIKFIVPMPVKSRTMNDLKVAAETRRRWRALLLVLKAKLEAVDNGIVEFQREFLAHIMTNGNQTVADQVLPNLAALVSSGKMPALLGPGPGDDS